MEPPGGVVRPAPGGVVSRRPVPGRATARTGRRTSRGLRRAVRRSPTQDDGDGDGALPDLPGVRAAVAAIAGGSHESVSRSGSRRPGPAGLDDLCRAGAVRRVLGQAALDQGAQRPGTAGQVRRLVQHAVHQRGHVPVTEGRRPGDGEGRQTAPSAQTSMAGVMARPRICSGAMNWGDPTATPLWVRLWPPRPGRSRNRSRAARPGPAARWTV